VGRQLGDRPGLAEEAVDGAGLVAEQLGVDGLERDEPVERYEPRFRSLA
jgi:hypothetical protein